MLWVCQIILFCLGLGKKTWKKLQAVQAALADIFPKSRHFEDFLSPISCFLTEDGGRRVEDGELRLDQGDLR